MPDFFSRMQSFFLVFEVVIYWAGCSAVRLLRAVYDGSFFALDL